MEVDVLIEAEAWRGVGLDLLAKQAFSAVAAQFDWPRDHYEVAVLGCDDARIAALNAAFREKPEPTNVLSWPSVECDTPVAAPDWSELGDLAIAFETCQREADHQSKTLEDHVSHLLVHGMLHLLGYDHIDAAEAAEMEAIEIEILAKMGVANPY